MRSAYPGYTGGNAPVVDRTGGKALTAAIRAAKVSRNELAERTGLSRPTIQNLEHGRCSGRPSTWRRIALALGTTADSLLGEE